MQRTKINEPLSKQMKRSVQRKSIENDSSFTPFEGNFEMMTSSGSTLLDLAISGERKRGGGFPSGILVEAFGPSQSGKTALLSEIGGSIERNGGESQFHDPEARLDAEFASLFGMHIPKDKYSRPDTITQLFNSVRKWNPVNLNVVNGIFGDSIAALSTDLEMGSDEGDKMGMRRAKEFSEQLRKTCRILKQKNFLMVCSNQIRTNAETGQYGKKYTTPGGFAFGFYSTVRLSFNSPKKIVKELTFKGKEIEQTIGIEVQIEVVKTAGIPYRTAPLVILYGYGIDDIRANLQFIKKYSGRKVYSIDVNHILSNSLDESIKEIENEKLQKKLKNTTIDMWEEIQSLFKTNRIKVRG